MRRIISLLLLLLFVMPAAVAAAEEPIRQSGMEIIYRGVRFQPVAYLDDTDEAGGFPERYRVGAYSSFCLVRFRCLDGAVTLKQACEFQEKARIWEYTPGKTTGSNPQWDQPKLIRKGVAFTEFDLVFSTKGQKGRYQQDLLYIDIYPGGPTKSRKEDAPLWPLKDLPAPEYWLDERDAEEAAATAGTFAPTPTPTPRPTPTPSPTADPTRDPALGTLTEDERTSLVLHLLQIRNSSKTKYTRWKTATDVKLYGPVFIAVFKFDDTALAANTLDDGPYHEYFREVPLNCLATSYAAAETKILVYCDTKYYGTYGNGSKGYHTTTRAAVIRRGKTSYYILAENDPPRVIQTTFGVRDRDHYGSYPVAWAIQQMAARMIPSNK